MCRREILDGLMRDHATSLGANLINGTLHKLDIPTSSNDPYLLHYHDHSTGEGVGVPKSLKNEDYR